MDSQTVDVNDDRPAPRAAPSPSARSAPGRRYDDCFDFVIVGGGSAGCALASRLSEDPANTVLLIEAGGRDRNPWIHIPVGYYRTMHDPRLGWGYETEPVPGSAGRTIKWPRGRVLGGCSSINGLVYVRGQALDYDVWAQLGKLHDADLSHGALDAHRAGVDGRQPGRRQLGVDEIRNVEIEVAVVVGVREAGAHRDVVAGDDGLRDLTAIIDAAPAYLKTGGALLLEHGYRQGRAVRGLLRGRGFAQVMTTSDACGLERVTRGLRSH